MIKCEIEKNELRKLHIKGGKADLQIETALLAVLIIKEMSEDKSQFKLFKKNIRRMLKKIKYEEVLPDAVSEEGENNAD